MIRVTHTVDAPNALLGTDAFGAGALVRLERAATEDGVYAEIDTSPLVADTFQYTHWDPSGTETHWYRWRVSNALSTAQTAYSDPFQGDDLADPSLPGLYASVDDVVAGYDQRITNNKLLARIHDKLRVATQEIIDLLGFDFFRHPQSGTETRLFAGNGRTRICIHSGLVPGSVSLVEVRDSLDSTWESLAATDWLVDQPSKPGHPLHHLSLSGLGNWSRYPAGDQLVRVTGAFGWPAVPESVREATVHKARQLLAWDPTRPGGPVGPEELGVPLGPNRMPDTMYRLRYDYSVWERGLGGCSL